MSRRTRGDRSVADLELAQSPIRMAGRSTLLALTFGSALCVSSGCAPRCLTEGVRHAAQRRGVSEASTVPVHGKPYLRFDASLRADLDELLQPEAEPTREQAGDLLLAANELSIRQTMGELDRMPPDGLRWLGAHYGGMTKDDESGAFREGLKERYREEAKQELDADLARLAEVRDVRRFLIGTRRRLGAAPGDRGRTTRALLASPSSSPP